MTIDSIPLTETRPRRRLWIPAVIVVALAIGAFVWRGRTQSATPAPAARADARPTNVVLTTATLLAVGVTYYAWY